jgi:hypothetical protein
MGVWGPKGIETAPCQRKTAVGLMKRLANLWSRKRITKKAYASRGQETIWEIPIKMPTLFPGP